MQNTTESAVITVNECSKLLKLSKGSIYQGCLTGEIPHVKVGRRILIPRIAIQKLLGEAGKPKEI